MEEFFMTKMINNENLSASVRMLDKMGEMQLQHMKENDPAAAEQMEKLSNLLSSEDFCKQFAACADNEAAAKLFADNGFALTAEQAEALMAQIKAIAQKLVDNDGELEEEDLEVIAGGASKELLKEVMVVSGMGFGASVGSAILPGVGSFLGWIIGTAAAAWLAKD